MKVDRRKQDFVVGDVVQLKCGSQALVIEGFTYEDKQTQAGAEELMTRDQLICLCTYQRPDGEFVTVPLDAEILTHKQL